MSSPLATHAGERLDEGAGMAGISGYQYEINEPAKTLKLWVRRKRGNQKLVCPGCGRKFADAYDSYEREVRDQPGFEYRTTVMVEEVIPPTAQEPCDDA